MWQASSIHRAAGGLAVCAAAGYLCAQPATPAPTPAPPAARTDAAAGIEAYLEAQGLRELLAEHLWARLKAASAEEKPAVAERLGKTLVGLIASAKSPEKRAAWEARAQELVKAVPDVQSLELRIDLSRTAYARAEDLAERWRLRLVGEEERTEAEQALRALKLQFELVGKEAAARVESLERAEENGRQADRSSEELADARRLRSVAFYYAGWAAYYAALVGGGSPEGLASDALKSFGWLLGGGAGRPASIDRLPKGTIKYDHIARAAVGAGLASGLRNQPDEALRFFDAVANEPAVSKGLKDTIPSRRLAVLVHAKRWADVERVVRLLRNSGVAGRPNPTGEAAIPLEIPLARLLAVLCFEASRTGEGGDLAAQLGQVAMGDLVARGQVGHVLDLARRYGTAPLGDEGFIAYFVRGVQQYEKAVADHKATGENIEEPAALPAVVNLYRESGRALDGAVNQTDAKNFPVERGQALVTAGRAYFKAGDMTAAADRFEEAARAGAERKQAEEALWLAIVALDRAVRDGATDDRDRLEGLSVLYVRSYPNTDRAATVLLRRAGSGGLPDEEAIRVLSAVPRESPVFETSRRQLARVLYRAFRAAPDADKAFASARFVKVGDELLGIDRKAAVELKGKDAADATERLITTCRQLLDALLSTPTPDWKRAEGVLAALQGVVAFNSSDLTPHAPEMLYRRFQIALAKDDIPASEMIASQLRATAGGARFAESAERLLYQSLLARYKKASAAPPTPTTPNPTGLEPPSSAQLARAVIAAGQRVIGQFGSTVAALSNPAVLTVHRTVAEVAADLWRTQNDQEARDLAIKLDRLVLLAAPGAADCLERLAELSEAAGDPATALDAWRRLASGLEQGTLPWHRARFESLRLLAIRTPDEAAKALAQQAVLYGPGYGPEPWGSKMKALHEQLIAAGHGTAPTPATPSGRPASGGGSGGPP
jgi:hypothetical protein